MHRMVLFILRTGDYQLTGVVDCRCPSEYSKLRCLRNERDAIDDQIQRLEWVMKWRENSNGTSPKAVDNTKESNPASTLESLKRQRETVRKEHRLGLREHHKTFHPVWGRLLKTGYQNSLLAHQIERFACLYTSHVGNLLFYSPHKSFR